MVAENQYSDTKRSDRQDQHGAGHDVFHLPDDRMDARFECVDNPLENTIHHLKCQNKTNEEKNDNQFKTRNRIVPREKQHNDGSDNLQSKTVLLSKHGHNASDRM